MAQQALINIEAEDEAEVAAVEAEYLPELIDLLLEINATVRELSADNEDTDEQMNDTFSENWKDADMEAA